MNINNRIFKFIFYVTLRLRREWFIPYLRNLEKTQYLSRGEIEKIQIDDLNELIKYSRENVPFYKDRLPKRVESLGELRNIPLLEKDDLRKNQALLSSVVRQPNQRAKTSGGSTGAPVTLLKDSRGMARELAATWRGYAWAGVHIGDRQVRFWGVPRNFKDLVRSKLIDFVCNRKRITAFNYDEKSLSGSMQRILKFNPDYFYGYVSLLRDFARYSQNSDYNGQVKVKSIIATSEVLNPSDRELLESAFNGRVYNEYGCGEVGTIAHECEHGSMHISAENMIVEILREDGTSASPGEFGEVVVTDLTNYSMPLIRYRLKDYSAISGKQCKCGRGLPILEGVQGREYDSLINRAGKKFHGEFFLYIVEDFKKIGGVVRGVQFVQESDKAILVNVVCEDEFYNDARNFIENAIKDGFDRDITVRFEKLESIAREPSGKMRVVKREIAADSPGMP